MAKKKYDESYIRDVARLVGNITEAKPEDNGEYTQMALSIQDAVQAARIVYGTVSQEELHRLRQFIGELVLAYIKNVENKSN